MWHLNHIKGFLVILKSFGLTLQMDLLSVCDFITLCIWKIFGSLNNADFPSADTFHLMVFEKPLYYHHQFYHTVLSVLGSL